MFTVVKFCRHRAAACRGKVKVREGPPCIKPLLLISAPDLTWVWCTSHSHIYKNKACLSFFRFSQKNRLNHAAFGLKLQECSLVPANMKLHFCKTAWSCPKHTFWWDMTHTQSALQCQHVLKADVCSLQMTDFICCCLKAYGHFPEGQKQKISEILVITVNLLNKLNLCGFRMSASAKCQPSH